MIKTGFIGTGNMGGALARAAAGHCELYLCDKAKDKAEALAAEIGASVCENEDAAKNCDVIFLAVKPNMAQAVLEPLADIFSSRSNAPLIVTMLAATAIEKVSSFISDACPVIRIMPNIPVSVGRGMILYALGEGVTDEQEKIFLDLLSDAGRLLKLDEKLIDAGSAVSGCGPAFAALFIEALADGGVACGLTRGDALTLAEMMVAGSADYLLNKNVTPADLKDAVCSPGGTTIAGVKALEEKGLRGAVIDAVTAAYDKTVAMR